LRYSGVPGDRWGLNEFSFTRLALPRPSVVGRPDWQSPQFDVQEGIFMPQVGPRRQTLDRIKVIMRRDLKLAADFAIGDDMPLAGGDMDLDSLDVLLLLTSTEKEFGFKFIAEEAGNAVFRTVTTLAQYIDGRCPTPSNAPPASAPDLEQRLGGLPHQPPFRFVTRLVSVQPGQGGVGEWRVTGDESFLAGHFPDKPIVPGVLIAEALGQISGLVVATNGQRLSYVLAHVDVKFRHPVFPPATVTLISRLTNATGSLFRFDVQASCQGRVAAEGSVVLSQTSSAKAGDSVRS
jgi:3-hydroxymyristoyl/3-hydroxydecanoyl-(acyl carrier protein) dehydratase/acyl carrier protein